MSHGSESSFEFEGHSVDPSFFLSSNVVYRCFHLGPWPLFFGGGVTEVEEAWTSFQVFAWAFRKFSIGDFESF